MYQELSWNTVPQPCKQKDYRLLEQRRNALIQVKNTQLLRAQSVYRGLMKCANDYRSYTIGCEILDSEIPVVHFY